MSWNVFLTTGGGFTAQNSRPERRRVRPNESNFQAWSWSWSCFRRIWARLQQRDRKDKLASGRALECRELTSTYLAAPDATSSGL